MSCTIVYDRRFIRTTRGIIPLILSGSSNCTDFYFSRSGQWRERLARGWGYFFTDETLEMTEEQLIAYVKQNTYGKGPDWEMFRLRSATGNWITSNDCHRWYRNGCKAASTLEQYNIANRGVYLNCHLHLYEKTKGKKPENPKVLESRIFTTAELEAWLDEARSEKAKYVQEGYGVYITIQFSKEEPLRTIGCPAGAVVAKHIGRKVSRYVCGYEKGKSVSYSPDPSIAIVFSSAETAMSELGGWAKYKLVHASSCKRSAKEALL